MLSRLFRQGLKVLLFVAGAQAALLGAVAAALRRGFSGPSPDAFPWEDRPGIELESGAAEADRWSNRFVHALAEKAREGVAVYAVFDDLASAGQPEEFKRFPKPINLLRFRRISGPLGAVNPRSAHRDHRKLLTVDEKVAFVGGFNIGDLYLEWRDTHVRVKGPAAREMERAFADFWNTHRNQPGPPAGYGRLHRCATAPGTPRPPCSSTIPTATPSRYTTPTSALSAGPRSACG